MISVVVAVRNAARFIGEALESALAQQGVGEIVVVDDGSTDGSGDIAARFPKTRVITGEPLGPGAARNVGARAARGETVAFLDADDVWLPDKLKLQTAELTFDPRRALCLCEFEQFLHDGCAAPSGFRPETAESRLRAPLLSALLLKREAFFEVGPFDERLATAEDVEWFCRAAALGFSRRFVPAVLLRKRIHDENTSFVVPGNTERLLSVLGKRVRGARGSTW